ncbi:hypothetical protein [Nocardia asteroides]|uniref:hypothetical protein n=1 Tax=Nocardia asteroides TaxID=1824 RepID=UPI001E4A79C7|nr:hypothetical protein [Nocardia asteroides]UGT57291.1 hypothetical protein LTT85_10805 [Nocardia asteroides]
MTYEDYKARVIAAQELWNRERSGIYLTQHLAQLSTIFAGETQPNHLNGNDDSYDHMTLAQMQSAVAAMKPSTVQGASEAWSKISTDLSTTLQAFNKAFEAVSTGPDGWDGQAASAAVTAVGNYVRQSASLPAAALAVSLKLAEMKTGLEQTQTLMPGLTERPTLTDKTLPTDGDTKLGDYQGDEAEDEARRILRSVYGQVAVQSDTGVPFMPTAPKIVAEDGGGDPSALGGGTSGPTGGNTDTSGTGGGQQTPEDTGGDQTPQETGNPTATDGDTSSPDTDPSSTDDGDTTAASAATPTTTNPNTAQAATPTSANPSAQNPASATPLGTAPGAGRGGGGTGGGGGRGGTSPGAPGAGRSVTGVPSGTGQSAAAAAAGRAAATAGRAGMMGMPGMGGAGARGQNDDEHRGVPDYLINQENGEILTGIGDIRTVPPVIGGDDGAQQ